MTCPVFFKVWTGTKWTFHRAKNSVYPCELSITGYTIQQGSFGYGFYEDEDFNMDQRLMPVVDYKDDDYRRTRFTTAKTRYVRYIHGYTVKIINGEKCLVENPNYNPFTEVSETTGLSYLNKHCTII
jgi:hypothetical protein